MPSECCGQRLESAASCTSLGIKHLSALTINTTNIYAEIDLEMKGKALALCDAAEPETSRTWTEKKGLMAFLKSL